VSVQHTCARPDAQRASLPNSSSIRITLPGPRRTAAPHAGSAAPLRGARRFSAPTRSPAPRLRSDSAWRLGAGRGCEGGSGRRARVGWGARARLRLGGDADLVGRDAGVERAQEVARQVLAAVDAAVVAHELVRRHLLLHLRRARGPGRLAHASGWPLSMRRHPKQTGKCRHCHDLRRAVTAILHSPPSLVPEVKEKGTLAELQRPARCGTGAGQAGAGGRARAYRVGQGAPGCCAGRC